MRVSSPIGDLPFEPKHLSVSRDGLDIDGAMGAWPAHVHVDATDLPALARLVPLRALTVALGAAILALAIRRRSPTPTRTRRSPHV